jgi:hypothetical protein
MEHPACQKPYAPQRGYPSPVYRRAEKQRKDNADYYDKYNFAFANTISPLITVILSNFTCIWQV